MRNEDLVLRDFMANHCVLKKKADAAVWERYLSVRYSEGFEDMKNIYGFDIVESSRNGERAYLVPRDGESVFRRRMSTQKKDAGVDKADKLYLVYFVCLFIIHFFCSGEGDQTIVHDLITTENLLTLLNEFCGKAGQVRSGGYAAEMEEEYGMNFVHYMEEWNGDEEGDTSATASMGSRSGIIKKALRLMSEEGLVVVSTDEKIYPGQRLKDLIDYTLRKERVAAIEAWFREVDGLCQD